MTTVTPNVTSITREEADTLAAALAGPLFLPGDRGYADEVAPYNLAMIPHPALVVGATSPEDVQTAVRFAVERGMPVAVQLTGHGPSVPADGAVLVSTRRMTALTIDPVARTARVDAGVRLQQLIDAAAGFGLAPPSGSAPGVGIVGYFLGGGVGVLGRTLGFAADHVTAVDMITADGERRHVTADEHPDLFWAVRGGKGNFGVVTSLVLSLFPIDRIYGGGIFFPGAMAGQLFRAYREWVADLPDEMTSSMAFLRLPPLPTLPEPLRGQFVVHLRIAYAGSTADGERLVAPLRAVAPAIIDAVGEMPYTAVGAIHADPVDPIPAYERTALLRELPLEAVDALVAVAGPDAPCPLALVEVRHLGGAMGRPPAVPNATGNRDAAFMLFVVGIGGPPDAAALNAYAEEIVRRMQPWDTGRKSLNFMSFAYAGDQVRAAYEPESYERLAGIKRRYDPDNTFRINMNVPPAA